MRLKVEIRARFSLVGTNANARGSDVVVTKSTALGSIALTQDTTGAWSMNVSMAESDTSALSGYYFYTAIVIDQNGKRADVANGSFVVTPAIGV